MKAKVFFGLLCTAFIGLGAVSCIDDDYDLDKEIDKTVELKNFTIKIGESYSFPVTDILGSYGYNGDFTIPLQKDASSRYVFGAASIDQLSDYLKEEYLFKEAVVTLTVASDIAYDLDVETEIYGAGHSAISGLSASISPSTIAASSETKATVTLKSSSFIHPDEIALTLYARESALKLNTAQQIQVKDIVINFPQGVSKKGD